MSSLPSYLKVAGIEGNLRGATVAWDWTWNGAEGCAPNVIPDKDFCIVTNQALAGMQATGLASGTLMLTPKVTCGDVETVLDPITLTVGVSFVEPSQPCCVGAIDQEDCPPCLGACWCKDEVTEHELLSSPDKCLGYVVGGGSIPGQFVAGAYVTSVNGISGAGSAAIIEKVGKSWVVTQRYESPDPEASGFFGEAVAISDNVVLVGGLTGRKPNAVYVAEKIASGWQSEMTLLTKMDSIGHDYGIATTKGIFAAVGQCDSSLVRRVDIFKRLSLGVWDIDDTITLSRITSLYKENIGDYIAMSGDLIVLGDPSAPLPRGSGAAHVFKFDGESTWDYIQTLRSESPTEDDLYGISVAVMDGFIAVGAAVPWGSDDGRFPYFEVFRFDANTNECIREAHISPPELQSLSYYNFAQTITINSCTLAIGDSANNTVYVYSRSDITGSWERASVLKPQGVKPWDQYGYAVALDSQSGLVVGALSREVSANIGSVFIYDCNNPECQSAYEQLGGTFEYVPWVYHTYRNFSVYSGIAVRYLPDGNGYWWHYDNAQAVQVQAGKLKEVIFSMTMQGAEDESGTPIRQGWYDPSIENAELYIGDDWWDVTSFVTGDMESCEFRFVLPYPIYIDSTTYIEAFVENNAWGDFFYSGLVNLTFVMCDN